jgi:hypothetical protein
MKDIRSVTTEIKPPSTRHPAGQVAHGCYTINGDIITLTNRDGDPVEDGRGKLYTFKLPPGYTPADEENAAGRLTREFRLTLQGKAPEGERVTRPLNYPNRGCWM